MNSYSSSSTTGCGFLNNYRDFPCFLCISHLLRCTHQLLCLLFSPKKCNASITFTIIILRPSRRFFSFGHSPASKAAPFSANVVRGEHLILFTRERIFKLHFQLLRYLIFFQLVLDILCDFLRVLSHCVYIISPTPKLSAPILEPCIRKSLVYDLTAFPFQKSYES